MEWDCFIYWDHLNHSAGSYSLIIEDERETKKQLIND